MLSSLVIHLLCYWAVRSQWCLCLSLGLFWEAHRFCQVLAGGITAGDLQQVFPGPFKSTWSFDPGPAPALLCVSFCLLPRGERMKSGDFDLFALLQSASSRPPWVSQVIFPASQPETCLSSPGSLIKTDKGKDQNLPSVMQYGFCSF